MIDYLKLVQILKKYANNFSLWIKIQGKRSENQML